MLITLTTDFGYADPFVGIMKGVLFGINPQAQIVDLNHGIPPQDIMAAALVLRYSAAYFPRGTIHVVVVDPGVGSARRPLLIESEGSHFIGPDNGVLSLVMEGEEQPRIFHLSNPRYQLQPTSSTFHGRDIFAPTAAYLSLGFAPEEFGEMTDQCAQLFWPTVLKTDTTLTGEIVYIDGFGNLSTNIDATDLKNRPKERLRIILRDLSILGLAANYAAVEPGEYVALINSWGLLEIAVCQGSARQRSRARVGDKVQVTS
ncbi:MAG TPA: SAM-dependent chlorinase/fluorinase [Terriglobales bacterium]|nr:SAM-dependent chlorinase/fluorinase [Terriglobales bacterium]